MEGEFHARSVQFLIERFDHYNDSVNNKGALYLSINTFVLGGICLGYCNLYKTCSHDGFVFYLLIAVGTLLLLSCLGVILFTILGIAPYLKDNQVNDDKPSLLFFGGIAKFPCNDYLDRFQKQDEEGRLNDSIRQVHSLAFGLDKKYRRLKTASCFLIVEYILLTTVILLTFLITSNDL